MLRRCLTALMAGVLALAVPVHAQPTPAERGQVLAKLTDAEIARRVDAALAQVVGRPEAAGLSVAVARGDRLVVERGAGTADFETNEPVDAATVFRIGSLTKQFTAAAIMKLVEQGKVGLEDPLAKYLPDFDTGGRTVTIRQLLNHASGIPNYTDQPAFAEKAPVPGLTKQDVLKVVAGVPFTFEPGTGWHYSNTNYFLLGMVIEKVTGRPYEEFLQQQFFGPLHLTHTQYASDTLAHAAQGYAYDPATRARRDAAYLSLMAPFAAGALASTGGDLLRWQIALTGGHAVSPASFAQMTGSTVKIGQGDAAYGFGLMIDRAAGMRRIWHNGGINGFNSVLTWWPDLALRTAVISNSEALPAAAVEQMILEAVTSDKPLPPPRTTAQPGSEAALRAAIAGIAGGTPDYAAMTAPMAGVTRVQLAGIQAMLTNLGPLQSLTFRDVDLNGIDEYLGQFANGAMLMMVSLDPQGKIGGMRFAPLPPVAK